MINYFDKLCYYYSYNLDGINPDLKITATWGIMEDGDQWLPYENIREEHGNLCPIIEKEILDLITDEEVIAWQNRIKQSQHLIEMFKNPGVRAAYLQYKLQNPDLTKEEFMTLIDGV